MKARVGTVERLAVEKKKNDRDELGWRVLALPLVRALDQNPAAVSTAEGVKLLNRVDPDTQKVEDVLRGVEAAATAGISRPFFPLGTSTFRQGYGRGGGGGPRARGLPQRRRRRAAADGPPRPLAATRSKRTEQPGPALRAADEPRRGAHAHLVHARPLFGRQDEQGPQRDSQAPRKT